MNKAGLWENVSPVQLNGTKRSMFGLAVEDIGDINQDSYKGNTADFVSKYIDLCYQLHFDELLGLLCSCTDLAVGAPQDDDGAGRVYIYHGSAQGLTTSPAQVAYER